MTDWSARVIAHLAASKAAGLAFEEAWTAAVDAHPPYQRDRGPAVRELWDDEPLVEAVRRYCDDAWHDRNPVLRHLRSALGEVRVDRHRSMRGRVA